MIDDRLSAPKADALPGCATPRAAVSLGKALIERNPAGAFGGNERQNGARTGNESPGLSQYLRPESGKRVLIGCGA